MDSLTNVLQQKVPMLKLFPNLYVDNSPRIQFDHLMRIEIKYSSNEYPPSTICGDKITSAEKPFQAGIISPRVRRGLFEFPAIHLSLFE
jgi:hypothetical protein